MILKTYSLDDTGYIKRGGTDISTEYPGLSLTFNEDGTYTCTNGKRLFFPTGTWRWEGDDATQILLDGDFPVTITRITNSLIQMEFTMDADHVNTSGRVNSVVGNYEVMLNN